MVKGIWVLGLGSWEEDTHWTKIIPIEMHIKVRNELYRITELTENEWNIYRNTIINYRNQIVSHHDLNPTINKIPNFEVAIAAANYIFDCMRSVSEQHELDGFPVRLKLGRIH